MRSQQPSDSRKPAHGGLGLGVSGLADVQGTGGSDAPFSRRALLVLGMHRSGTSALTRVLSLLGADLPANLMQPKADNNELGFWESLPIYALNEEILASAGTRWDDWRRFNPDWFRSPEVARFKARALQVMEREFTNSSLFVLKDPRICRLVPFWNEVLREFDADVNCVIVLRHPLEVAASLRERDGFSRSRSLALWLRHSLDVERTTRGLPRVFLSYDSLLQDWRSNVAAVADRLALSWPRSSAVAELEIDGFLNERHRHHRVARGDKKRPPAVGGWVRTTSTALASLVGNPSGRKAKRRLDAVRRQFDRASRTLGSILAEEELCRQAVDRQVEMLSQDLSDARAAVAGGERRIIEQEQELSRLPPLEAEAASLAKSLAERDALLLQHEARARAEAASLAKSLAERDALLSQHEARARAEAASLAKSLAERDALLSRHEAQAEELAATIDDLNSRLSAAAQQIVGLEREVARAERERGQVLASMAASHERIAALESESASQVKLIRSLEESLAAGQQSIAEGEADRTRLAEQLESVSGEVTEKTRQLGERDAALAKFADVENQRQRAVLHLNARQKKRLPRILSRAVGLPPRKCGTARLSLRRRLALSRFAKAVSSAGLFDEPWYVRQHPEVVLGGWDPLWHWITVGWTHGYDPHPLFDMDWYSAQNPEVDTAAVNPLEHFLQVGARAGRQPHPLFDPGWYLHHSGLTGKEAANPLAHYLRQPEDQRVSPHPLFASAWYRDRNSDVARAGVDPLIHYLDHGVEEGRDPHPLFQTSWYLRHYDDIASAGLNPLVHYLEHGWQERRRPNPLFDTAWYLEQNPDITAAGMNPLLHYVRHGAAEGRDPNPFFDTDWYVANNPEAGSDPASPLAHYLWKGGWQGRDPGPLFDTRYYLTGRPEAGDAAVVPLAHFLDDGGNLHRLAEVWPDHVTLRGAGQFLSGAGREPGFQPSARFIGDGGAFLPRVTVIVPNYNHEAYLPQRLDSIFAQTYSNYHVLLLDDCSTDGSRKILEDYHRRYPDRSTLVCNSRNSGGVFHQWRKGIEQADGELIWIAESDDYCEPNLLEELVPYFMDEAVQLAYARSVFVDRAGRPMAFTFDSYLAELSPVHWKASYVATAHHEVSRYLGRKNTIPNVSSAVFRKPDLGPLLRDEDWTSMKICGDWIFYLHVLKGGKVAYSVDTANFFRFHESNSSARTYATPVYYREHEAVACEVARHYKVSPETLDANRAAVKRFFDTHGGELAASGLAFDDVYDYPRILDVRGQRLPNVLMAGFALSTGGGEVFPIWLANHLKKRGFPVTFFNFMGDAVNPAIRKMLRPDIPLVERNEWCPDVPDLLEEFGIDVVHSHHGSVDVYFAEHCPTTRPSAYKHVVTMHGMYETMPQDIFVHSCDRLRDRVTDWVYIADKNLQPFKQLDGGVGGSFRKVPNGMERPETGRLSRDAIGLPEEAFVVCLASRAIPEKGWESAIEIVSRARQLTGLDIQLLLLGDGPMYEKLRREGVPLFVRLLGFRGNVVDFYALSDLGMLPTTFAGESFPLSVIECFMAGRPMMVTDVGEVRTMLTDSAGQLGGWLIDFDDLRSNLEPVAVQLAEIATNKDQYAARREVAVGLAERFDMNRVGAEYAAIYTGTDERRTPRADRPEHRRHD